MFRRFWFVLPFFLIGCNDSPPGPPPASSIQLAVEDASCTEAWFRITLTDSNQPRTIALKRDGQTVLTAQLTANDSSVIDEGLLPNHAYTYQAVRMQDSIAVDLSANAQLTTLDSTSHDWSFVLDTLGDGNSSVLYDVAIMNDTLVYAVGEMYLRDSSGQLDPTRYNAALWNGVSWNIMRIPYYFQGQPFYNPIQTVFAFSSNDIWFAGNGVIRWNGQQYIPMEIPSSVWGPNRINKIWGSLSNNLYIVGDGGSLARYANGTWQRVQSGTTADMRDLWGHAGSSNEEGTILAIASSPGETKILSLAATGARDTLSWPVAQRLRGIWMSNKFTVYVSGPGIWRNTGARWNQMAGAPQTQFLTGVRGSSENNIFAVAWRGVLAHFNGVNWHQYAEIPADFNFEGVAVSQNTVVAVGFTGGLSADKAAVVIGRRVP